LHINKKRREKKIQNAKSKSASLIALFLMATIAITLVALPTANAHDPPVEIKTYSFLAVAPNPIGVDQTVILTFWLSMLPPTANGQYGDRWTFNVEVTKPDGSKEAVVSNYESDPVGSGYATYTPDKIGTYTFQMSFLGKKITNDNPNPAPVSYNNSPYINDTFLPSTSPEVKLTVQEEQVEQWPAAPLPTGYWTRPINGQNREWYAISGNWLRSGHDPGNSFAPYTTAPGSAHIMWTKPITFGGLIGGEYGSSGTSEYYAGLSYESKFIAPVIIQGKLYYNEYPSVRYPETDKFPPGFDCVDLRTGQTLWTANTTVTFGQVLDFITPDQYGGVAYLWGPGPDNSASSTTTWYMMDAFNGQTLLKFVNIPSLSTTGPGANMAYGSDGSLLIYVLDSVHNWLAMWNSTLAVMNYDAAIPNIDIRRVNWYYNWRPQYGATIDGKMGYQWNVTVPSVPGQSISKISSTYDVILATAKPDIETRTDIAYDAETGERLWVEDRTIVPASTAFSPFGPMADGVYTYYDQDNMQWYAYDYNSGKEIFGPTTPYTNAWGMYGAGSAIAYDKLYTSAWDGMVHCYDLKTGDNLWNYATGSSGFETAYGVWPLPMGFVVADEKIYACAGHTHLQPMFRGAKMYCIDANTGNSVWNVSGWMQNPSIADGYLVAFNVYDNSIYCFGKGLSGITVSASPKISMYGDSVLVEGSVTDQSPGETCTGVPAAGTPAISDDSMSAWMEYLYMEQPMPKNATGVEVTLETLDPNGNFYEIANTTSDASGMYSYVFTPEVPGLYTIIATFEGSNSYYSSVSETAINVAEAPQATPTPTPPPTMADIYLMPATIAIIAAIVIATLIIVLMLRKR
jgi:outer membrane protein assembly factor BamB